MKLQKRRNEFLSSPKTDWVAVGDAGKFTIFEKRGKSLTSVKSFSNEKAHLKISELQTDQPGRSFNSFSRGNGHSSATPRHAYTSHQDPKEHAVETFVKTVSEYLDTSYKTNSFDRLVLVANSRLLGKMRSSLAQKTLEAVTAEHPKDFAWVSEHDLKGRLQSLMTPQ